MLRVAAALCLLPVLAGGALLAGAPPTVVTSPRPDGFVAAPWLVGVEAPGRWAGLPDPVNAPDLRERVAPGQGLTVMVGAEGTGRDAFLQARTYAVTFTLGAASRTFEGLRPSRVRRIKAVGSDMAFSVLAAGGIKPDKAEGLRSLVSAACFEVAWTPPAGAQDGPVRVQVRATGPGGEVHVFPEVTAAFWTYDRTAREGGFGDAKAAETWTMGYYQHPEPTRLLHLWRALQKESAGYRTSSRAFAAAVLRSDPAAAQDLLQRLRGEAPVIRRMGAAAFLDAGQPRDAVAAALPLEDHGMLQALPSQLPPLPDPLDLEPDTAHPLKVADAFDQLWSRFLVTGDTAHVRLIAGRLAWREEGKAFVALRKSGGKPAGITLDLVKGLAYMAAGWSLGSFYRTHPLVADAIEAWKRDPAVPEVVRQELGTLLGNEAFRM
ncbi:hypothetical protein [Mesoterricola sediminis]|uniref:Uncharacterized protein n=1 Tax=Mesoterricola sediminis TaxID=2927980 RepID=A0AA48GUQ0_9BACT|nr:hypothetical protein [Mesoterricola sediminis]BDU77967.1 hypothetical protein METESE_29250 [Mesoterricola sediminis]